MRAASSSPPDAWIVPEAKSSSDAQIVADRYELRSVIGKGGTSTVWLAYDRSTGGEVALKLMADEVTDEGRLLERFRREAHLTRQLEGEWFVHVVDHGIHDGRAFIVMDRLEGESLQERLHARSRLSLPETLDLLRSIAEGLDRAHALEIVHRDLKPGNIFFVLGPADHHGLRHEAVKILDLGVAKDAWADGKLTETGSFLGTAQYMSPEQVRSGKDVDARSDLWSLGVIVYRAIVGRLPFIGPGMQVVRRIADADFDPPSKVVEGLPSQVDAFFARALAKDKELRFQSARAMLVAFADAIEDANVAMGSAMVPRSPMSSLNPTMEGPVGYGIYASLASSAGARKGGTSEAPTAHGSPPPALLADSGMGEAQPEDRPARARASRPSIAPKSRWANPPLLEPAPRASTQAELPSTEWRGWTPALVILSAVAIVLILVFAALSV